MANRDRARLQHMLDAAQKAVKFATGRTRADLDSDEMFMLAEVRLIEIIGEAAVSVSEETRHKAPTIPWQQITATHNRLIHGYFNVDLDIVWSSFRMIFPLL